jgi:hypothetical protein
MLIKWTEERSNLPREEASTVQWEEYQRVELLQQQVNSKVHMASLPAQKMVGYLNGMQEPVL